MKLSKIKLSGFKSFVDNTTIDLNGSLIGIVGPNGCGKSNVIDAIRWVLGESSAKQLRGGAMQDVIFNGSDKRSPVSRASVELVFDNTHEPKIITHSLYATYSEISVKRVISRNGESEYLINNQIVRRKDIIEMFLGTGVGSRGYAIIEQGMISRIIEARPDELRVYLEEASGVSKYREKRRETLSKLEYTKDNLTRIHDLQIELAGNIEKLTVQADKAREYQRVNTQLNELNIISGLLKKQNNQNQYQKLESEISNYNEELEKITLDKNSIYEELQINYEQKELFEEKASEYNSRFNELRATIARNEERESNNNKRREYLTNEVEQNIVAIEQLNIDITNCETQILDSKTLINTLNTNLITQAQNNTDSLMFNEFATRQNETLNKIRKLENELVETKHGKNLLNNTFNYKKQQLQTLSSRQKKLVQETSVNILDLDIEYKHLLAEIEDRKALQQQIKSDYEKCILDLEQIRQLKITHNNLVHTLNSEIKSLESSFATIKQLVDSQIKNENNTSDKLKLLDVISVDSKYMVAVNAILDTYLSAELMNDFSELIFHSVDCGILNNTAITCNQNTVSQYVVIKDKSFNAVYTLLNQYKLALSIDDAINSYKDDNSYKYVTLDGSIIGDDFYLSNTKREIPNLLSYQAELNVLESNRVIKQQELFNLESDGNFDIKIDELSVKINEQKKLLEQINEEINTQNIELTKLEQNHTFIKNHQERVLLELETVLQEITFIEEELFELTIKVEEQDTTIIIMSDELSKYQEQLEGINQTYLKLEEQEVSRRQNIERSKTEILLLEQKINTLNELKEDKNKQVIGLINKNSTLDYEVSELSYQIENNDLQLLKDEIIELTTIIEEMNINLKNVNNKIEALKDRQQLLDSRREELKELVNSRNLKLQEYRIAIDNINELLSELSISDDEVESLLVNNILSLSEAQSQISICKKQIEAMGLINLAAIQDLEEAETKYTQVQEQIADLEEAITTLEDAINQIDKTTSKMLYETYNKVNIIFNDYFRLLFGGGGARLELTEDDILVAGVQIFAQPLGKKNSSIHLLSGGEKALTAVSLVFAFFSLSPSPFCILDEVDAPLDDANTMRFCKLVKQLAVSTQFIYISHNRLAMEMANQLVGVTMQEKGVSTTVSVKLDSE